MPNLSIETLAAQMREAVTDVPLSWGTLDLDAVARLTEDRPPEAIRSQWYSIPAEASAEIAMRSTSRPNIWAAPDILRLEREAAARSERPVLRGRRVAAPDFALEQRPPRSDEDEARALYDSIHLYMVPTHLRWNSREETLVEWRVRWTSWARNNPTSAARAVHGRPETTGPEGTAFLPDGWTENRWEA